VTKVLAILAVLATLLVGCSSAQTAAPPVDGPSSAATAVTAQPTPVTTVDAQQFLLTASDPAVTVLDVRTPAEFAAGHLAGAVNVDVESAQFVSVIETLDRDGTYALYCRSGRRSQVASDAMAAAGFTGLYNLSGGLSDLQAAGGAVVAGTSP
jgi:rhodanese-related sulfurtransferase